MLLFKWRKARGRGIRRSITDSLLPAARSSLFLGTFAALIWLGICVARNTINPYDKPIGVLIATFLGGLAILIESTYKQHQLALYCIPKAVEALMRMKIPIWALESPLSHITQNIVFSASMAMLIHKHRIENFSGKSLHSRVFKFCISSE